LEASHCPLDGNGWDTFVPGGRREMMSLLGGRVSSSFKPNLCHACAVCSEFCRVVCSSAHWAYFIFSCSGACSHVHDAPHASVPTTATTNRVQGWAGCLHPPHQLRRCRLLEVQSDNKLRFPHSTRHNWPVFIRLPMLMPFTDCWPKNSDR
jgi:hypothetical protein